MSHLLPSDLEDVDSRIASHKLYMERWSNFGPPSVSGGSAMSLHKAIKEEERYHERQKEDVVFLERFRAGQTPRQDVNESMKEWTKLMEEIERLPVGPMEVAGDDDEEEVDDGGSCGLASSVRSVWGSDDEWESNVAYLDASSSNLADNVGERREKSGTARIQLMARKYSGLESLQQLQEECQHLRRNVEIEEEAHDYWYGGLNHVCDCKKEDWTHHNVKKGRSSSSVHPLTSNALKPADSKPETFSGKREPTMFWSENNGAYVLDYELTFAHVVGSEEERFDIVWRAMTCANSGRSDAEVKLWILKAFEMESDDVLRRFLRFRAAMGEEEAGDYSYSSSKDATLRD